MERTFRSFCVTHEAPKVPAHLLDFELGIGEYFPVRGAHISSLDAYWANQREVAYGAAGNYAVLKAIERLRPQTSLTGIFSHKKVVIRLPLGKPAARYSAFRELDKEALSHLDREATLPKEGFEFLIGAPIRFPQGVMRQYSEKHRAIDLCEYLTIAAEIGVLSLEDVQQFCRDEVFIPGGCELGVYPTDWLYESLGKLELLARVFLTRSSGRIRTYDRYQVRAVGFLAERLGSFFLRKEIARRFPSEVPPSLFGNLVAVTERDDSYSPALA